MSLMNILKNKKQNINLNKLQKLSRYKPGFFSFDKYTIEYIDPLSLYHEYNDIFKNRIYHFNTKNCSPIIIDAGGYIGMSVLYFKSIYPDAKITVFEPDPDIFTVLQRNIQKNNLLNVTAIKAGLGKEEKKAKFFSDQADGGSICDDSSQKSITVQLTKLSKYINQPIDLLKMNIEGAEGDVFEEIKEKLPLIKEIIFEYHAFCNLPQNLGEILSTLDKSGFKYVVADIPSIKIPIPFHMPKDYKFFNLVYAKNIKYLL